MNKKEILKRIASKEQNAFEHLYERYERSTYSLAYRMVKNPRLAEKVIEILFTNIWDSKGQILQDNGKLSTKMLMITRNIAENILETKKHKVPDLSCSKKKKLQPIKKPCVCEGE